MTTKRIKKSNPKCPNPLFVKWLEEWKEEAATRRSEMQFCFGKALTTMKKCPIPLKRGRDCIVLQNFGHKLCQMLDKKLSEYNANEVNDNDVETNEIDFDEEGSAYLRRIDRRNDFNAVKVYQNLCSSNNIAEKVTIKEKNFIGKGRKKSNDDEPPVKKVKTPEAKGNGKGNVKETLAGDNVKMKANRNTGPYIPAWRSGGYAILLTLYDKMSEPDYIGYVGKADLQSDGQKYCDKSLKKSEPGNRYTAWSSMSILIEKGLVTRKSNPAQYRLTDAGLAMALQLSDINKNDEEEEESENIGLSDYRRKEINSLESTSKGIQKNFSIPSTESRNDMIKDNNKNVVGSINFSPNSNLISPQPSLSRMDSYFDEFPLIEIGDNNSENEDNNGGNKKESETVIAEENNKRKNSPAKNVMKNNVGENFDGRNGSQKSVSDSSGSYDYTLIMPPQTFDVILIIDDRETAGGKVRPKDDATIAELGRTGIKFEVKNLKIGDFVWVARSRNSGEELVLPYVVERKRIDDFGSSIKDGRYYEQKFRLKRSGLQYVTYLVENHGNNQYSSLPLKTLFQAGINTLVQDGFILKWTNCHKDSMIYLASMTHMLSKIYQDKTLIASKKEDLTISNIDNDLIQLMYFKEFNKSAAKVKTFKAKEMFIRQLIQLRGVSVEKALAIVNIYPTPLALKKAYDNAGDKGENLLAGIQIGRTKQLFGPALSKTLHQFYTRKDF